MLGTSRLRVLFKKYLMFCPEAIPILSANCEAKYMDASFYHIDNIPTLFNQHTNSKQASHEKKHVLLVEINLVDKQQLSFALKKLGYSPIEISNADNNTSHALKVNNEKISKSCLIIVDAKSYDQGVLKSVNDAQNAIFSQPVLHRPVLR